MDVVIQISLIVPVAQFMRFTVNFPHLDDNIIQHVTEADFWHFCPFAALKLKKPKLQSYVVLR